MWTFTLAGYPASAAENNVKTSGSLTDAHHGGPQEPGPRPHHAGPAARPAAAR